MGTFLEKSKITSNSLDNFIEAEKEIIGFWNNYENNFNSLNEKFGILSQNINEGIREYTEGMKHGTTTLLKDYDDNLSKVVDKFTIIIEQLDEKLSKTDSILETHKNILEQDSNQVNKLNGLIGKNNVVQELLLKKYDHLIGINKSIEKNINTQKVLFEKKYLSKNEISKIGDK